MNTRAHLEGACGRGYLILTSRVPKVEGKFYTMAENRTPTDDRISITKLANQVLAKNLVNYILTFRPDVIVCTHVFAAGIVNSLKERGLIPYPHRRRDHRLTIHPSGRTCSRWPFSCRAASYSTTRPSAGA
jgi:processive 1,2-diacylglycerol beta-glucosyltransferase